MESGALLMDAIWIIVLVAAWFILMRFTGG
jgi:hypothetical protein